MTFREEILEKIGEDAYAKITKLAEKEVATAIQMPLVDEWGKEKYYYQSFVLPDLLDECRLFQDVGLTISPVDLFNVLFRCKIFLAATSEDEYHQRNGGAHFPDEYRFTIDWSRKSESVDVLIDEYLERLNTLQEDKVLMSAINSFKNPDIQLQNLPNTTPQAFFQSLNKKLNTEFLPFFEGDHLIEEHKKFQPGLGTYDEAKAKYLFQPPSFGHRAHGSEMYCRLYSTAWLRTFFNMLRIAGYVYPGQVDFGMNETGLKAPTTPVFLGTHTWGVYSWDEDKKEPWAKIPDGCLFLSFGYRGLSDMWIDNRTFGGIEKFFLEHKKVFECLKNPWTHQSLYDLMPTLDILSAATQIPDTGAKVLQVYCCLEHLFVPKNVSKDNKKYIVGGINALKPDLLPWFNDLYKLRCMFAHRGFVIRDEKTRGLITSSIQNIMTLLVAKLNSTE